MAGVYSALKSIEILERQALVSRSLEIEARIAQRAEELFQKGLIEGYRSKGVFCGIDIKDDLAKGKIEQTLWNSGIQLSCYRFDPILRTILALTTTDEEIDTLFMRLGEILATELSKIEASKTVAVSDSALT